MLYEHYNPPNGFNFDVLYHNTQWLDTNGESEAQKLMKLLDDRASHYKSNDLFVVFGEDFNYMKASQNYQSMDNMIDYMNSHYQDKYLFKYSTPSQYVDALSTQTISLPLKYDDLFPYSDKPDAYWTGYFSSRPNYKEFARRVSR